MDRNVSTAYRESSSAVQTMMKRTCRLQLKRQQMVVLIDPLRKKKTQKSVETSCDFRFIPKRGQEANIPVLGERALH